jgi:hypothetical protein
VATHLYDLRAGIDIRRWRPLAAATGVAAAAGVAAAEIPLAAFGIAAVVLVLSLALFDLQAMERTATMMLVGGAVLLGYGFSNLGIPGGIPLPATEILFLPLALIALAHPPTRLTGKVLLPLSLYALLVGIRLLFDYPVWGVFAIRDTTAALEAFILVIGYRSIARDGVETWFRRMGWIFTGVLVYGFLTAPIARQLADAGPTVGLQRPTPLFDQRGIKYSVVAAGLYLLLFSKGWVRVAGVGIVAGLTGIYQARSLYLLFPLAILVLGWAARRIGRVAIQLIPVVALGAIVIAFAGSLQIEGRRGPVDPAFIEAHARTLLGEEGPQAGSIRGRVEWFSRTWEFVTQSPGTVAVGVGLGPDLTFGLLEGDDGQLVRKPHDDYLEVFARTGLLGFVLFMWLLLACLVPIARRARAGSSLDARFCAWILAASFVYLGVAAVQPLLSFSYGSVPLFFLLGMGVAIAEGAHQRTGAARAARGT